MLYLQNEALIEMLSSMYSCYGLNFIADDYKKCD